MSRSGSRLQAFLSLANMRAHLQAGASAPWILIASHSLIWGIPQAMVEVDWMALILVVTCLGALGGILPDMLEPPSSPRHRGALHYVLGVALLLYVAFSLIIDPKTFLSYHFSNFNNMVFLSFFSGYVSHVILDYTL